MLRIAGWIERASEHLFLSVVTAAEIADGIAKARRTRATTKASALSEWWGAIEHLYSDRILPIDLATARLAGLLIDRARAAGISAGFEDVAIAATAIQRRLTVLTRNVADFAPLGVDVLNPYDDLPPLAAA